MQCLQGPRVEPSRAEPKSTCVPEEELNPFMNFDRIMESNLLVSYQKPVDFVFFKAGCIKAE